MSGDASKDEERGRILILGHALNTKAVDSYPWDARPADLNVNDYDTVVVDFTSEARGDELSRDQMMRFLGRSETWIFMIGTASVGPTIGLKWVGSPMDVLVQRETGTEVRAPQPPFEEYFRLFLPKWSLFLTSFNWHREIKAFFLSHLAPHSVEGQDAGALRPAVERLALTTFGGTLAFDLHFVGEPGRSSGHIVWLPAPLDPARGLDATLWVLREVLSVALERPEPSWAAGLLLPGEEAARTEISDLREQVVETERAIVGKQEQLVVLTGVRRLLYEQDDPLEFAAWNALRELGAEVTEPTVKGKHDGTIKDPSGRPGVLEIKGRRGSVKLVDVRQLEQWKLEVDEEKEVKHKGLLIANLQMSMAPAQRQDNVPPNCRELLERYGFALLPTPQLFQAIVDHREKRLDVNGFWNALFGTVGVTTLPERAEEDPATRPGQ